MSAEITPHQKERILLMAAKHSFTTGKPDGKD
jgi:hypothetical protein